MGVSVFQDLPVGTQEGVASLSARPDLHPYTKQAPVLKGEIQWGVTQVLAVEQGDKANL